MILFSFFDAWKWYEGQTKRQRQQQWMKRRKGCKVKKQVVWVVWKAVWNVKSVTLQTHILLVLFTWLFILRMIAVSQLCLFRLLRLIFQTKNDPLFPLKCFSWLFLLRTGDVLLSHNMLVKTGLLMSLLYLQANLSLFFFSQLWSSCLQTFISFDIYFYEITMFRDSLLNSSSLSLSTLFLNLTGDRFSSWLHHQMWLQSLWMIQWVLR